MKLIHRLIILIFLVSCGVDEFSPNKDQNEDEGRPIEYTVSTGQNSDYTLIKPEVDFLFLWDNSSSTTFISPATKNALNNTINLMSSQFDFHILMAPLVQDLRTSKINDHVVFISDTPDGLSSEALGLKVDRSLAAQKLDEIGRVTSSGSLEAGLTRSVQLLARNRSNGIFRNGAYLVVVLLSNQDDSSYYYGYSQGNATLKNNYINARVRDLLCVRGNTYQNCSGSLLSGVTDPISGQSLSLSMGSPLNNAQMRFSTIAIKDGDSRCPSNWGPTTHVYRDTSPLIYTAPYSNGTPPPTDQGIRPAGSINDSYNLCDYSDYNRLFDGINNSIHQIIVAHKYNYWKFATAGAAAFDPNQLVVKKDGVVIPRLTSPVTNPNANGYTFSNTVQTQNTRYYPTAGEPQTGYLIKLYGNARVTYPESIAVQTQTPADWYGFVHLQTKPLESSINLTINGVTVSQGGTNGWELVKNGDGTPKYFPSKNILIKGPGDYSEVTPGIYKSGYFLKLNGSSVYSNSDTFKVIYDPSS